MNKILTRASNVRRPYDYMNYQFLHKSTGLEDSKTE